MRIFFFLICITIASQICQAQNYQPGKIKFLDGKTDTGWIEVKSWNVNPKKIKFKNPNGKESFYTVSEVNYFEVENSAFQRAIVNVDKRSVDPLNEFTSMDTTIIDTLFLRVLIKGNPISLYQYYDFKSHFYVSTDSMQFQELIYGITNDEYKLQLREINSINWDQQTEKSLSNLSYNQNSLLRFVKTVNKEVTFKENANIKKYQRFVFFAGIGIAYQTFKIKSDLFGYKDLKFNSSSSPIFTAGLDILLGTIKPRTAIKFDVSYYNFKTKGFYDYQTGSSGQTQHTEYTLSQQNVVPSLGITYNFIYTQHIKIYAGGSSSLNLSKYKENTYKIYSVNSGTNYSDGVPVKLEEKWSSVSAQLGAILNDHIELRLASIISGSFVHSSFTTEGGMKSSCRLLYRF